ncbi:mitochondrial 37S ribosomal protein uS7m [Dipodascopsis tothii]|uniref:mitochondrial 37S ribosomal protein uS7m n=1 Tax=Dipodascopsis tothii TaxID=44089 RepID=UPI0034CEEC93
MARRSWVAPTALAAPAARSFRSGLTARKDKAVPPEEAEGTPVAEVFARDQAAQEQMPRSIKEEVLAQELAEATAEAQSSVLRAHEPGEPAAEVQRTVAAAADAAAAAVLAGAGEEDAARVAAFQALTHSLPYDKQLDLLGVDLQTTDMLGLAKALFELRRSGQTLYDAESNTLARIAVPVEDRPGLRFQDIEGALADDELAELQKLQARKLAEFAVPVREDVLVSHLTNLIMSDGKKARAQKVVARAFYIVRLRTGLEPLDVLRETVGKLAPLFKIVTYRSGAKSFQVPKGLNERQRNRRALTWIIEGTDKRESPDFGVRLGDEIVAVWRGSSSAYDKRDMIHRTAMANRAYIGRM